MHSHALAVVLAVASLVLAASTSTALAVEAGGDSTGRSARDARTVSPWAWSVPARNWSRRSQVLPAGLLRRGPRAPITRGQFLDALLKVQALGPRSRSSLLTSRRPAPALKDAPANSTRARAISHGWIAPRAGKFDAAAPITADDAALAVTGALGLRPSVSTFAVRLRTELPGVRVRYAYAASHALVRTLGMRYNVQDPHDALELGPRDAVNVAHGAYMLHVAATRVESWKLEEARTLASTFDLPELGPNQLRVLGTGVRQLGQPYVWAGETEGPQPEGKGGFDCSGFAIRVLNQSGVPKDQLRPVLERTTYTQSAIPAAARITKAKLQPGDLMFFGDRGPTSTPTQNFHAGIYMGNGWFIHSSGGNGGVAINSLDGWWGDRYSWGRRALLTP